MSAHEAGAAVNRGDRPLSPHLSIYRLPLTALTSIAHRITGAGMAGGAVIIAWWFVAAATGPGYFAVPDWLLTSWLGHLGLIALLFAFCYHLCNGVRHLIWDAGCGLTTEAAEKSGRIAIAAAGVLTVIVLLIGLIF